MNRVVLVGRLTRDPELRTSSGGNSFVMFTIAVNRTYTSNAGEREADFINCLAFGKQAENLTRFIKKGGLVGVDGRLQTRNYNAPDGTRRFVMEVLCDNIQYLEPKTNSQGGQGNYYNDLSPYDMQQRSNPRQQQPAKKEPFEEIQNQFGITDDDLPF